MHCRFLMTIFQPSSLAETVAVKLKVAQLWSALDNSLISFYWTHNERHTQKRMRSHDLLHSCGFLDMRKCAFEKYTTNAVILVLWQIFKEIYFYMQMHVHSVSALSSYSLAFMISIPCDTITHNCIAKSKHTPPTKLETTFWSMGPLHLKNAFDWIA